MFKEIIMSSTPFLINRLDFDSKQQSPQIEGFIINKN